jgi:lysophospholipase L1-like esterase
MNTLFRRLVTVGAIASVVATVFQATGATASAPQRTTHIVSLGDSYAAGQGAPGPGGWDQSDVPCHRSGLSAVNRAVGHLIDNRPYGHEIEHLNVTCSGAAIVPGILTPMGNRDSQLDRVNAAYGTGSTIDVLTIGVGGNDAGFEGIVRTCGDLWQDHCDKIYHRQVVDGIDLMRERFRQLVTAVQGDGNGNGRQLRATVRDVFVTTYPDPTKNAYGYCNDTPWYDAIMGNIFARESRFLSEVAVAGINQVIREAVAAANSNWSRGFLTQWHLVEAPNWDEHGWCAADPWLHHHGSSRDAQGDEWGTAHPNAAGYGSLGDVMLSHLYYINNQLPGYGFKLVSQHSNRPLDLAGENVVQGAAGEIFDLRPAAWDGSVQIVSRSTGKCVWNAPWLGAYAQLRTCSGAEGERWRMVARPWGAWTVESVAYSGGCLDLADASTSPGAQIVRWNCHQGWNQLWWITPA